MSKDHRICVVTDTGCSYRPEDPEVERGEVTLIPLQLSIIEDGQWQTKQETELTTAQFYNVMMRMIERDRKLPKTSGLSPGVARDVYLNLFKRKGVEAIYSTHITKAHSQAWDSARIGAQNASEFVGKDLPITVADSKQLSIGQWWVAQHAAKVARRGASIRQIMDEVSELIPKIQLRAVLETFENLKKGGRAEQIKGLFASMLSTISIHPILGLKDGKLDLYGKARNASKARKKIVEMVGDMGELVKVAVIHTNALEFAEEVKKSLEQVFKGMIPTIEAGPALATHAGEKAVAIVSQLKSTFSS
jgi:DegV family protein with EDD domain